MLVTGDLTEALALSDRIGVMFKGRLMPVINRNDQEGINRIPQLMAGLSEEDETTHAIREEVN